jgi:hypothetical protein
MRRLRSDNAKEFVGGIVKEWCVKNDIVQETSLEYQPEMNGTAERMNRSVIEGVRTLLMSADLSKRFWGEAACYFAFIYNRTPHSATGQSPFEMMTEIKPNLSLMQSRFQSSSRMGFDLLQNEGSYCR